MQETWRWFGPPDPIPLAHIRQAGAAGIVTALHHVPPGTRWTEADIAARKAEIEAAGLRWSVVESIPVPDVLKARAPGWRPALDAWKDSLALVARAGVGTICYNFMPVVDWTRTDLRHPLANGGFALRFDAGEFAAYDVFILQRPGAADGLADDQLAAARARFEAMGAAKRDELERTIIAGLPGSTSGSFDRASIRGALAVFDGIGPEDLRANLREFLAEVLPVAEAEGARLAMHPDDPPFPLFGLPRVLSTEADYAALLATDGRPANGITFCVGSLGARGDNDLVGMVRRFGDRIHFAHLRQVRRDADGSFTEAEHLDGSSDMVGVVQALLREEARRRRAGRADAEIPLRPDHGHLLAGDIGRPGNPGYSYVGRLKGLAELRGVIRGLQYAGAAG